MHIHRLKIQRFRTIADLELELSRITAICGPNSVGKSNILQAIAFAFQDSIAKEDIYRNLPREERDLQGGPRRAIKIDLEVADVSGDVARLAGETPGSSVTYSLTARKTGTVMRKLGGNTLPELSTALSEFTSLFAVVYVPAIRDLEAGGLDPFKRIFAETLKRSRGQKSLRAATDAAKKVLEEKAKAILGHQKKVVQRVLGARELSIDTSSVNLDGLYDDVSLRVQGDRGVVPLVELGTGHQSTIIVNLYQQIGEQAPGETVFLLEEPDNHLHPATARSVANSLKEVSETSQVFLTTHSPLMLSSIGLQNVRALRLDDTGHTRSRIADLGQWTEVQIARELRRFNIRATESLLANRVLVVEGPFDATVVARLVEKRHGLRPDDLDLLIVSAGGKQSVVELCALLKAIGADWAAMLDWDAALSPELPFTRPGLSVKATANAETHVNEVRQLLERNNRRGKGIDKALAKVLTEIQQGRPRLDVYERSHVQSLLRMLGSSQTEQRRVKQALVSCKKRDWRKLLEPRQIHLLPGTLDQEMTNSQARLSVVEQSLIDSGKLPSPIGGVNRARDIRSILKKLAHDSKALVAVTDGLDAARLFNNSALIRVISKVVNADV